MSSDTRRHAAGKGDTPRKVDPKKYAEGYDRAFPKKYPKGKKTVETKRGGYRFVWYNESIKDRTIGVDVYREGEGQPFMEWVYARVHGSLGASITLWSEQALLEARSQDEQR